MSASIAKPNATAFKPVPDGAEDRPSIEVSLSFKVDLRLLRRQKRALVDIRQIYRVSADQEDAVEAMLNMIDFIQDSIVDQGLAPEEEVFSQMPLLFEIAA
jgi:hypothetical protein